MTVMIKDVKLMKPCTDDDDDDDGNDYDDVRIGVVIKPALRG